MKVDRAEDLLDTLEEAVNIIRTQKRSVLVDVILGK